jgi:hypothetical protein
VPGRERVEEWRESAADVRREPAGEGGAGRDEVRESRDERNELRLGGLKLLSNDGLALSVNVAGVVSAGGFWTLKESGVENEMDVPSASPSSSSSSGDDSLTLNVVSSEPNKSASPPASAPCGDFAVGVVAWPFTVGLGSGCSSAPANGPTRPLPMPSPVMFFVPSPRLLSSVDCGSVTAPDVFPAAVGAGTEEASTRGSGDAGESWSVLLLPTFIILDSVDLRLEDRGMGAYSCADGMGGGKNGDPGDGKGDEEDSLLMVTVSEGVS